MSHILSVLPLLALYCGMQVVATCLSKYGTMAPRRWIPAFIVANLLNVASIWVIMLMYRLFSANIVMALAVGSAFITGQAALALVFRQRLSRVQIGGIVAVVVGLVMVSA